MDHLDAYLRRSLPARALGAGARAALPASRGTHPDHPRLDRALGRSHPQALSLLHEPRAALPAATSRQVAAPDRLFHALAAHAGGDRGARERAVAARRGAGLAGCGDACRGARARARGAPVPGLRSLPAAAADGADLLRARRVPRHGTDARRSAAPRRLQRLRRAVGDRALSAARPALPSVREPGATTLIECPARSLEGGERHSWIRIYRITSRVPTSSGAPRRARTRSGSPPPRPAPAPAPPPPPAPPPRPPAAP